MVDTTQKPYFQYDDAIDSLLKPIQSMADVRLIGYLRTYLNNQRFYITPFKAFWIDYYANELYKKGVFEKPYHELPLGFHMWDHLPYSPPELYIHHVNKHNLGHGLTIIQQHDRYSDSFVFATCPDNNQINNFYLNQKELLQTLIHKFYKKMERELKELESHTFLMNFQSNICPKNILSLRQKECALLLADGFRTKEIAKKLLLSPRTVEYHIDVLKKTFQAQNRVQLIHVIKNLL